MTKKEKTIIDSAIRSIYKHKNRKFIDARIFNKRAKPGLETVVIQMRDIIDELGKLVKRLKKQEKKNV